MSSKTKGDVHEATDEDSDDTDDVDEHDSINDDDGDDDAGPMSSLAVLLYSPPPPPRKKPVPPAVKSTESASKRPIPGKKNGKRAFVESPASRDTPKTKRPRIRVVVDEVSDTPEDDSPSKKSPKIAKHGMFISLHFD